MVALINIIIGAWHSVFSMVEKKICLILEHWVSSSKNYIRLIFHAAARAKSFLSITHHNSSM